MGLGKDGWQGKKFDKRGKNLIPPAGVGKVIPLLRLIRGQDSNLAPIGQSMRYEFERELSYANDQTKLCFRRASETALTNKVWNHYFSHLFRRESTAIVVKIFQLYVRFVFLFVLWWSATVSEKRAFLSTSFFSLQYQYKDDENTEIRQN